jgi:acetyl coenzyme A synthetase (ADP forming)-like protein
MSSHEAVEGKPPLDAIFRPRSVAVIGASRRPLSIGREIIHNLVESGFTGPVYPVNPKAQVVASMKAYRSVEEIPDPVDLAVIVVPRDLVVPVAESCARKGVKGLVVITAGFREVGGPGAELEERLLGIVREAGMRMVGPNCMGVVNTEPEFSLNASFSASSPLEGNIGFISQSGALGEAILSSARALGLGLAMFVSMGNKADVSGNDLLGYWEKDDRVKVVLLYLESVGSPRKFNTLARRISHHKPIIMVKAGRTAAGARAASSHTGSIVGREMATAALMEQCGVLRVGTIEEMFTLASAFARQPLPAGPRTAVVTNAGGPGILATDALVQQGMTLATLGEETRRRLGETLPPEASLSNPVDMIASASPENYEACVRAVLDDPDVDGLLTIFVSPVMIDSLEIARAIVRGAEGTEKPVLVCFMGRQHLGEAIELLRGRGFPVYSFPEEAARALASMNRYRLIRERPMGDIPELDVDRSAVSRILETAAREGREWLDAGEVERVLEAYGLPMAESATVQTAAEAIDTANRLGFPVVLKAVSRRFTHKSDVGGVILDLRSGDEVWAAFREIEGRLRDRDPEMAFQVQKMVRGGRETILGMVRDETFGPLLMFGLGGIYVEVLRDVAVRVHPVTDADAREMIRSLRGFPLLTGTRGEEAVDLAALEEALLRLDRLAGHHPSLIEVDMNPFRAGPDRESCLALDARMRIALSGGKAVEGPGA